MKDSAIMEKAMLSIKYGSTYSCCAISEQTDDYKLRTEYRAFHGFTSDDPKSFSDDDFRETKDDLFLRHIRDSYENDEDRKKYRLTLMEQFRQHLLSEGR